MRKIAFLVFVLIIGVGTSLQLQPRLSISISEEAMNTGYPFNFYSSVFLNESTIVTTTASPALSTTLLLSEKGDVIQVLGEDSFVHTTIINGQLFVTACEKDTCSIRRKLPNTQAPALVLNSFPSELTGRDDTIFYVITEEFIPTLFQKKTSEFLSPTRDLFIGGGLDSIADIKISPDDRFLAFTYIRHHQTGTILILNLDTRETRDIRVSHNYGDTDLSLPLWTESGTLLFKACYGEFYRTHCSVYEEIREDMPAYKHTEQRENVISYDYCSNGKIVYSTGENIGVIDNGETYGLIDPNGPFKRRVVWSPSCESVLYEASEAAFDTQVYIMDYPSLNTSCLTCNLKSLIP